MVKVAPSLLSADFTRLADEIKRVGNADWLHLDVMDGHYVPNITIGVPVVKAIRKATDKFLDCHLMIANPDKYIKQFADAGANLITFHVETVKDPAKTIRLIKSQGVQCGISANNKIAVEQILPYAGDVDLILIMSVDAGFGGQSFNPLAVEKIVRVKKEIKARKLKTLIEVDGGVDLGNAKRLVQAGADVLVSGTTIFSSPNPAETIEKLRNA